MKSVKWTGGEEHWVKKGDVHLFLWRKKAVTGVPQVGPVLFVHGSSMASQPTYDLQVPGRPSVMEWFAERGFDTWTVDNEGYGRSDKDRDINFDCATGADDVEAAAAHILEQTGAKQLMVFGSSSGALKAAMFAQRRPELVSRLALDAMVWTGEGSHTLAQRKQRLPEYLAANRRRIDREFVQSVFTRDHAGGTDQAVVDAFADAILTLDTTIPNGTYVDMCSKLPLVDPSQILNPVLVMRGEYDGIASFEDVLEFFSRLPNMNKQFNVMRGISHASTHQKNYLMVYQILHGFFTRADPVYQG